MDELNPHNFNFSDSYFALEDVNNDFSDSVTLYSNNDYSHESSVESNDEKNNVFESIEDFNASQLCLRDKSYQTLIQINARSLPRNFSKINAFLASLTTKPTFLSIAETWMKANVVHLYNLPGYKQITSERGNKRGGGISVFVQAHLNCVVCNVINQFMNGSCECLAVEVVADKACDNLLIVSIYRPPSSDVQLFLQFINNVLDFIMDDRLSRNKVVIAGDFNLNLMNINIDKNVKEFVDAMTTYGFHATIHKPSRVTEQTATLIDNIFINFHVETLCSGIIIEDFSDHYPVYTCFLDISKKLHCKAFQSKSTSRSFIKENYSCFVKTIQKVDWNRICDTAYDHYFVDVDLAYNKFRTEFSRIFEESFQAQRNFKLNAKNGSNKTAQVPWMTDALIKRCKMKSRLLKIHRRFKNTVSHTKYKLYSKKLKSDIKNAELEYFTTEFKKSMHNPKDMWGKINHLLKPETKTTIHEKFKIDNNYTSDLQTIPNAFNDFFTNVGPDLQEKIPQRK